MSETNSELPLVIIVDPDDDERIATGDMLLNSYRVRIAGTAQGTSELARLMSVEPDIVVLDVAAVSGELVELIRQLRAMSPRCEVILTCGRGAEIDTTEAVMAGARGLVRKPVIIEQLLGIIYSVFEAEQLKRQHLEHVAHSGGRSANAKGGLIAVYSPKGGVGCTTIASNLALALRSITNSRVALVDFDLQFGDVDVFFDLHSSHGVHELMRSIDDLDASILEAVMVKHASGVHALLPPPDLEMVDQLTPEALVAVLKALRKHYDYVVVDMWHSLEDITLAVMDLSNSLLVVTTPEIPALRDTIRLLDLVERRSGARGKVQIVLNRYPSKCAVSLTDVERSLRTRPAITIPSDGHLITTAINHGVSFLNTQGDAATNLKQLAAMLIHKRVVSTAGTNAPAQAGKRSFGLRGRSKVEPAPQG